MDKDSRKAVELNPKSLLSITYSTPHGEEKLYVNLIFPYFAETSLHLVNQ